MFWVSLCADVQQTKIFITSEVPIAQIFAEDESSSGGAVSDQMRQMMDDLVSYILVACTEDFV